MAGGLFAISRRFFFELGGYDPELVIWGGEQYELSFKTWQCGGVMLDVPCSRLGHVYRGRKTNFPDHGKKNFLARNYRRVIEVWMDEYGEYVYARKPEIPSVDPGDLTAQMELRKRLNCRSFKWYMTNVAFDLTNVYPLVEPPPLAEGRVRSKSATQYCVDANEASEKSKLLLTRCDEGTEINFTFTWRRDVKCKTRKMCWDVPEASPKSPILLYSCHGGGGNQLWRYHEATSELKSGGRDVCLDHDPKTLTLFVNACNNNYTQQWIIDKVDSTLNAKWDSYVSQVTGPLIEAN